MPKSFTIPSIFTAVDKFTGPVRAMGGAVAMFVSKTDTMLARSERAFRKMLSPLRELNKMLSGLGYYVGLFTVMLVLRNAVNVMGDFQQANKDLALVMETTIEKNKMLAFQARNIGLQYGIAATEVSKLQYVLATLGFKKTDIMAMTPAISSGAIALRASPEDVAEQVGAIIQSFKQYGPQDAQRIVDLMVKATNETALNFDKIKTMLPTVSKPADVVNMTFEEVLAHLGVLSNAMVHVATAGTATKNMMIDSSLAGKKLDDVLGKIATKNNALVAAYKKFDRRSAVSAVVLASELEKVGELTEMLTNKTTRGLALMLATERLNTWKGTVNMMHRSYEELILSIEDGTGTHAANLMQLNRTISAMLLMEAGSDQARQALARMDSTTIALAEKWRTWVKWIGYAAAALIIVRAALWAWAGMIVIVNGALLVYNIMAGIMTALTFASSVAIDKGAAFMWAYRVALWAVTAAQWLFNAACAINPIVFITMGIIGLIGAIGLAIYKWDEWGGMITGVMDKLSMFIPQLMMLWGILRALGVIKPPEIIVPSAYPVNNPAGGMGPMPLSPANVMAPPVSSNYNLTGPMPEWMKQFEDMMPTNSRAAEMSGLQESISTIIRDNNIQLGIESDRPVSVKKNDGHIPIKMSSSMDYKKGYQGDYID